MGTKVQGNTLSNKLFLIILNKCKNRLFRFIIIKKLVLFLKGVKKNRAMG